MRKVNKAYILKQTDNFEQDIGSVVAVLNGELPYQESWDTTSEGNWKAILTFLSDIRVYLEDVEEEKGYEGTEVYDDDELDVIVDDIPPEDEVEDESSKVHNKGKNK